MVFRILTVIDPASAGGGQRSPAVQVFLPTGLSLISGFAILPAGRAAKLRSANHKAGKVSDSPAAVIG